MGGHSSRLTPTQKKRIKEYLIKRDGLKCMICGREEKYVDNLEIDHINGNASDHRGENLQLAHHRCNAVEYHKKMQSNQAARDIKRQASSCPSPNSEVILNREYEPEFRKYCFVKTLESVKSAEPITRNELRIEAREHVGCSSQTSYSYMERLFAKTGPLVEDKDLYTSTPYVRFRNPKDSDLSVEELIQKYPKEGRRYAKNVDLK